MRLYLITTTFICGMDVMNYTGLWHAEAESAALGLHMTWMLAETKTKQGYMTPGHTISDITDRAREFARDYPA